MTDHSDDLEPTAPEDTSKSQRKRELHDLREIAEQLLSLSAEKVHDLAIPDISDAILEGKRITKGNARKRHIQYIAKLIRNRDPEEISDLTNLFDPQSIRKEHKRLERWRSGLLTDQGQTFAAIVEEHPVVDRQHLQQLVRRAKAEHQEEENSASYRKLFQFLRGLTRH
ncbi:MAG TPA: ribosome-associated protein [Gammaproteobacteria bacterium]|nr:ribosome-associated protein [Gammaproteobacteria bacterium]